MYVFVCMLYTKTPKKTGKKKRGIANPQYKSKIKLRTTGTAAEVCCVCFRHLNCDWCCWVVVQYKYKISPSSHLHPVWTHQVTINNLSKWPPDPRILILSTKKLRRYNEFSSSVSIYYYQHLRIQVEKRDECLTPAAQIDRLTKPGHTYRNLNPFEVLQVYNMSSWAKALSVKYTTVLPRLTLTLVWRMLRRSSDGCQSWSIRTRTRATRTGRRWPLTPWRERGTCSSRRRHGRWVPNIFRLNINIFLSKACLEVVEEAKGRTNINMEEKRRKLRKEGKPQIIEEDNPVLFKKAVGILTMKLFADLGE